MWDKKIGRGGWWSCWPFNQNWIWRSRHYCRAQMLGTLPNRENSSRLIHTFYYLKIQRSWTAHVHKYNLSTEIFSLPYSRPIFIISVHEFVKSFRSVHLFCCSRPKCIHGQTIQKFSDGIAKGSYFLSKWNFLMNIILSYTQISKKISVNWSNLENF